MKINLLHPFSAEAIGLKECDLYESHSKPHQLALRHFAEKTGHQTSISYFTHKLLPYNKKAGTITKKFYPVTSPLGKRYKQWRAQHSIWHHLAQPANLTIINMSGHGSRYTFKYADMLRKKELPYIAMIGGINMSYHEQALAYYQQAHHIIVHTSLQRKNLLKHPGFSNLDIRILPLGVDTEKFKPKQNIDRKHLQLLFVGRITPLKRIELAIEVVAALKDRGVFSELRVVGFLSDKVYHEKLIKKIKDLKLERQINFLGAVKQSDLIPYYQEADMLLLPSEHESFGMVMVEAMACGTPVAAVLASGGPDEIITHGSDGVLTSKDDYANNLCEILKDRDQLVKFSKAARQKVKSQFSLHQTKFIMSKSINDALSNE